MTIAPGLFRTSIRIAQQSLEEDPNPFSLLIPFDAEKHRVTQKNITNKVWLEKTVSLLQESCDVGLFRKGSIENLVKTIFQDVNRGWCKGLVDCVMAQHDVRVPVPTMVQSLFNDPEPLFFAQLLYQFDDFLESSLSLSKKLHALCDDVCSQKKDFFKKPEDCKKTQSLLKDLKKFLDQENIRSVKDERFLLKKRELIHSYFGNQSGTRLLERKIGIEDLDKFQKIDAILKKVSQLREEVLGAPLSSSRMKISLEEPSTETVAKIDPYAKKLYRRIRMIQAHTPGHVWLYVRQGAKLYKIDTGTGLSERVLSRRTSFMVDAESAILFPR